MWSLPNESPFFIKAIMNYVSVGDESIYGQVCGGEGVRGVGGDIGQGCSLAWTQGINRFTWCSVR